MPFQPVRIRPVEEEDRASELIIIWRLFPEYHLTLGQGTRRYIFEGERASILW